MSGRVIAALLLVALPAVANAAECSTKRCTLACAPGESCVLQTANCIRAPCPPIQLCVAGPETSSKCTQECGDFQECRIYEPDKSEYCADVCVEGRCPEGSTCELREVQCIRAPCPPVASCTNAATTQDSD